MSPGQRYAVGMLVCVAFMIGIYVSNVFFPSAFPTFYVYETLFVIIFALFVYSYVSFRLGLKHSKDVSKHYHPAGFSPLGGVGRGRYLSVPFPIYVVIILVEVYLVVFVSPEAGVVGAFVMLFGALGLLFLLRRMMENSKDKNADSTVF